MPTPPLPRAELRRAASAYRAALAAGHQPIGVPTCTGKRSARAVAGEQLGYTRAEMQARLSQALAAGMLADKGDTPAPDPHAPPPRDAIEQRRLQDRLDETRAALRGVEAERDGLARKLETITSLRRAKVEDLRWLAAPAIAKRTVLMPMLCTSDFQVGEVIRPEDIEGLNAYNMDIFAQRYQLMIERTLDVAANHVGTSPSFPGFIYLRLGDAISGEIHPDLAETNDLSAVPAIRHCYRYEREGIRQLRARFGRVLVVSVGGNHGRTTLKPRTKRAADLNHETALAWWLESAFEGDPKVVFQTSRSADAYFRAMDWPVLASHGERMGSKGGQGYIGPGATILRGHQKLQANWTASGLPVSIIATAHLHYSMRTTHGVANGALVGYSELARDIRAEPDAARQWLLFVHATRCISQAFDLQLSDLPRRAPALAEA
jgi:hypothetical protein